jgi:hypothetical protein
LQSRFHLAWVRGLGSPYGNHPTARRYNSSRVFRTFPFPEGLSPNRAAGFYSSDPRAADIASSARRLDELRRNWLNPPNLVRVVPEVVPGFPDRLVPANDAVALTLRGRTLTNLYNERPHWLEHAHRDLDAAVARAYGWAPEISEEDAVAQLLDLNQSRVTAQEQRPQGARRVRPEQLQREPEFPPAVLPGGRTEEEPAALPAARPTVSRRRRRRRRGAS